jgi:hypothetical protein
MSDIEKSAVVVQKENELAQLKTKRKKILTQLKRNKTILQKLQDEIVNMQQQMSGIPDALIDLQRTKEELNNLFREAQKADTIADEEKEGMKEFLEALEGYDLFEEMMGMDEETFHQMRAERGQQTDEFDRKRAFNVFQQFEVEVPEERKREIRKIYVELAQRFHPDRAKSTKEKAQFHQLMQELNAAYERSDLATLLALKKQYADTATLIEQGQLEESGMIDVMDAAIDRVQNEISGLTAQLKRLKAKIKQIRASELGELHRVEREAARYGEAGTEDMLEGIAEQKADFQRLIDGLKVYIKTGEMPEDLQEMLLEQEEEYYFDDELEGITVEDLLEAFSDFMEEEEKKTRKRK